IRAKLVTEFRRVLFRSAAYLHARAAEALNSAEIPSKYPMEKLLTGDPEAGKAYFNGAGGCKICHAPTGDLAMIAAKYSPIDLEEIGRASCRKECRSRME